MGCWRRTVPRAGLALVCVLGERLSGWRHGVRRSGHATQDFGNNKKCYGRGMATGR